MRRRNVERETKYPHGRMLKIRKPGAFETHGFAAAGFSTGFGALLVAPAGLAALLLPVSNQFLHLAAFASGSGVCARAAIHGRATSNRGGDPTGAADGASWSSVTAVAALGQPEGVTVDECVAAVGTRGLTTAAANSAVRTVAAGTTDSAIRLRTRAAGGESSTASATPSAAASGTRAAGTAVDPTGPAGTATPVGFTDRSGTALGD